MIRALRDSLFGQLFLGGIVVAIILAFLFTGAGGGGSLDEECALTLGRICVEPRDFQAAYGLTMSGIDGGAAKKLQLQQKVARGLAEREVLSLIHI